MDLVARSYADGFADATREAGDWLVEANFCLDKLLQSWCAAESEFFDVEIARAYLRNAANQLAQARETLVAVLPVVTDDEIVIGHS